MNLSAEDNFRIYTRLLPEEVMKRVGEVTLLPRRWANKQKVYLGRIGDKTFEMTRRIDRKAYKSRIPVVPVLIFVPRFMKASVGRDGDFTTIDFEAGATRAVRGAWILTASLVAAPPVFIVLFLLLFIPLMYAMTPSGSTFHFDRLNAAELGGTIGKYVGAWVGVSIVLILSRLYDVYKFKKRYAEILTFEKQALAQIFDGQAAEPVNS